MKKDLTIWLVLYTLLERNLGVAPGISQRFSTSAVIEDPITPPVEANYTQLLINGQLVDAASGKNNSTSFT